MGASRTLRLLLALALFACSGCAATVPWPPPSGSCIEAHKPPGRRKAWRYWIDGRPATRDDVERIVYLTPELEAQARRYRRASVAFPIVAGSGIGTLFAGNLATIATGKLPLLAISATGLVVFVTGMLVTAGTPDPFQEAVNAFNASERRRYVCSRAPRPSPPTANAPPPPSREGLPILPSGGWVP